MPVGAVRHFPAGTYDKQMKRWTGRKEMELVSVVHSVWYMFKHLKMGDWGEGQLRIAKWLMPEAEVPPEPTRKLDDLINRLWHGSWWSRHIVWQMRGIENG